MQSYMIYRLQPRFAPPTDVIELNDKLIVRIEIAGMRAADFNVALANHHLVVSGVRERPPMATAAYHQVEIGHGEFRVEVTLPWHVDQDSVAASYKDGFLQIELPRRAEKQVRIIDVVDAEEDTQANE